MKQTICDICGKPILESELNTKYHMARGGCPSVLYGRVYGAYKKEAEK